MAKRTNYSPVSGTLNTLVAGSVVNGATIVVSDQTRVTAKSLSAQVSVTAATATLTVAAKWQVSDNGTTWLDLANGSQNAAGVVLTTGTAAAVTKAIPAPDAVFGWAKCRLSLVTGVATGAAGDLYSIGYNYRYSRVPDDC